MLSSPDDCIIRHPKASRRYGVLSHYKVSFWVPFVFKEVKMIIKEYNYLPEEAIKIRNEVFVKEQGFVEEFDEIDGIAKHIVLYEKEHPISTCRIYFNSEKQSFVIGRIAVSHEKQPSAVLNQNHAGRQAEMSFFITPVKSAGVGQDIPGIAFRDGNACFCLLIDRF